MRKKMNQVIGGKESIRKVKGFNPDEKPQIYIHEENLPNLNEFTTSSYKEKFEDFREEKLKSDHIILTRAGIPISKNDLINVDQETATSARIICIFINYLKSIQRGQTAKYNKYNQNRCYFNVINISSYDILSKTVKYEFCCGFQNEHKKNMREIYNNYDKASLIFKYDERWIGVVVNLYANRFHVIDFLSEDLSRVTIDNILDCIKYVTEKAFGLKYESNIFYNSYKVNFYCDCGLYVLNYIYKSMNNEITENITIKFKEKEIFRKQLIWLLLTMRETKRHSFQFYDFPDIKSKPINDKRHIIIDSKNRDNDNFKVRQRENDNKDFSLLAQSNNWSLVDHSVKHESIQTMSNSKSANTLKPIVHQKIISDSILDLFHKTESQNQSQDKLYKGLESLNISKFNRPNSNSNESVIEMNRSQFVNLIKDFKSKVIHNMKEKNLSKIEERSNDDYFNDNISRKSKINYQQNNRNFPSRTPNSFGYDQMPSGYGQMPSGYGQIPGYGQITPGYNQIPLGHGQMPMGYSNQYGNDVYNTNEDSESNEDEEDSEGDDEEDDEEDDENEDDDKDEDEEESEIYRKLKTKGSKISEENSKIFAYKK